MPGPHQSDQGLVKGLHAVLAVALRDKLPDAADLSLSDQGLDGRRDNHDLAGRHHAHAVRLCSQTAGK